MSTTKKLPAHGTRSRYRLEIKKGPDGIAGKACDRCRTANSRAVAAARAKRAAEGRRSKMHIVDDVAPDTIADTPTDTAAAATDNDDTDPKPGPMVTAITLDLDGIPEAERVPFHATLAALALQTAAEADDTSASPASRAQARRQLFEVLKSLRTRKEGDGTTALDAFLADFGSGPPAVPGRPA